MSDITAEDLIDIAKSLGKNAKVIDGEVKVRLNSSNLWVDFNPLRIDDDAFKLMSKICALARITEMFYDDEFKAWTIEVDYTWFVEAETLNEAICYTCLSLIKGNE